MIYADIMIVLMALAVLGTICATAYSVSHSLRTNRRRGMENGVPVGRIGWAVVILLVCVALPAWLAGSFTDMCMITAGVMLLAASAAVAYSKITTARLRQ